MEKQSLENKKNKKRTYGENSSLGKIQDRITELEEKVEELENK